MNMQVHSGELSGPNGEIEIYLDGIPVEAPLERRSLSAIRLFLETKSLEQQRVLCALSIDGRAVNLTLPLDQTGKFTRVDAESIALGENDIMLLKMARQQADHARECLETALTLVLINDSKTAQELWWNLALQLKQPIVTLSLLPDELSGPAGGASVQKLRLWQLEQVTAIIRDVELACGTGDTILISDAMEKRVLPWICRMQDLLHLWHETVLAGSRLGIKNRTY